MINSLLNEFLAVSSCYFDKSNVSETFHALDVLTPQCIYLARTPSTSELGVD